MSSFFHEFIALRRAPAWLVSWPSLWLAALVNGCDPSGAEEVRAVGGGGAHATDTAEAEEGATDTDDTDDGSSDLVEYEILACPDGGQGFASEVVEAEWGDGETFGRDHMPDVVLGGPRGAGCCAGSLDVVSLGDGGSLTLSFGERRVVDEPGADFVVFENAFWIGGERGNGFVEYGRVEVSEDGENWREFPCDGGTGEGCAGRTPTLAHPNNPGVDVFDPDDAGGDAFDLAELGMSEARYVRVSDIPQDDMGFDLDAVAIIHGKCD